MRTLVFAVASVALLGAAVTADQTATSHPAATPSAAPKLAANHPATKAATPPSDARLPVDAQNTLVGQYCAGCHSERGKAGGLVLAGFDAATIDQHPDIAEKMIRKLRTGMMPPPAARRPDAETIGKFVTSLETRMDAAAAVNPNPGWRPFQRLNRAEYERAVKKDLLGLDVDVTAFLPPDTISKGFDNVADVQSFSPTLMESYLRAASQISRLAIGDKSASATSVTYKIGRTGSQMRHVDGAPMGTRGGVSVMHTFPADGDYVVKVSLHNEPLGGIYGRTTMATMDIKEQVEVSVNGERACAAGPERSHERDGSQERPRHFHAADSHRRRPAADFRRLHRTLRRSRGRPAGAAREHAGGRQHHVRRHGAAAHARRHDLSGRPTSPAKVSDTVSRRMVFYVPSDESKVEEEDLRRRDRQGADHTRLSWRTVATPDDVQDANAVLRAGAQEGRLRSRRPDGAAVGARQPAVRVPSRTDAGDRAHGEGGADLSHRRRGARVAALVYFVWGAPPDAELMKAANAGALRTPAGLEKQVRRMLADKRSESLSTRFAGQWLRLQDLEKDHPDYLLFPQYDDTLAQAMLHETELFFDSIVRNDRPVPELLTADYSFVNERLAKHYGIPDVTGSAFRRVTLPDYRRGLLGQGSILTLTSNADRIRRRCSAGSG